MSNQAQKATTAKATKRILSVSIKRMIDESPDTSWLGEYASSPASEYSIDRAHSLDCAVNNLNREAQDAIAHAMDHLNIHTYSQQTLEETVAYDDAHEILVEAQDAIQECDCGERGDQGRNEYRYFNGPIENYNGESPEDIRKYVRQDYERMESLNHGDWCFIGIRAEARVQVFDDTWQEITSGGLWGTESDSDADYLKSIEDEQLAELREQLAAIGFSKRAISAAFRNVERES
jgi:hypothetical protein